MTFDRVTMYRYLMVAVAITAACAGPGEDCADHAGTEAEAGEMVEQLCLDEGLFCEARQSTDLATTNGLTVFWSPVLCAENLAVCRFALWHEKYHVQENDDERRADCFAAMNADGEAVDAARCFFLTTYDAEQTYGQRYDDITHCAEVGQLPPPRTP